MALVVVGAGVVGVAAWLGEGGPRAEIPSQNTQPAMPDSEAQAQFAAARVFFGHQSVGQNIIEGLSTIGTAPATIVESRDPQPRSGGVFQHAPIGVNGDPLGKIRDFEALINGGIGSRVDVALMKLCYVDFSSSTDPQAVFDAYRTSMEALERAYPNVTFLYTTAPLTTDRGWLDNAKASLKLWLGRAASNLPENIVRERYNALVRQQYRDSGRLLDIAAIESQLDNGNHLARNYRGFRYMIMNPAWTSDGAHLNARGSETVARQLLSLVARYSRR